MGQSLSQHTLAIVIHQIQLDRSGGSDGSNRRGVGSAYGSLLLPARQDSCESSAPPVRWARARPDCIPTSPRCGREEFRGGTLNRPARPEQHRLYCRPANHRSAALLPRSHAASRTEVAPRAGSAAKQSGGEFASAGASTRAQDAALQVTGLGATVSQHACRGHCHIRLSAQS